MEEELKETLSWTATVQMAGTAWARHKAPSPYTKDTLETAAQNIESTNENIARISPAPASSRDSRQALQSLPVLVRSLAGAVEKSDSPKAVSLIAAIKAQERILRLALNHSQVEQKSRKNEKSA